MNYEEKKQAKIDRFKRHAENAKDRSSKLFDEANKMGSVIPFGQPILIGHHSEKSHRNYLSRIHNKMDKAIEEQHKADYWERRAQIAESNCIISADDPEAIAKLTDKLTALQEYRDRLKKLNAKHIAFLKNPDLNLSDMTEKEQAIIRTYGIGTRCEPHPVARFQFANLSARIRDVKKRIEILQSKPKESKEKNIAGIIVRENVEENRIQLIFPGKPAEEVRKRLKSYGFRWCPTNGAWQRFLNNNSKYETNLFLEPFVEGKWKI